MPQITIDDDTHQRLKLAARVAGINIAEVIRILADDRKIEDSHNTENVESRWVPIFSNYLDSYVTAKFHPKTGTIHITSGELEGKEFPAPSSAAIAVVQSVNPSRDEPHTNGWRFWKDKRTRGNLDSQYERPR